MKTFTDGPLASININETNTDPDGHGSRSFAGLRGTNMIPHVSLSIRLSSVINTMPIIFRVCSTACYSFGTPDKEIGTIDAGKLMIIVLRIKQLRLISGSIAFLFFVLILQSDNALCDLLQSALIYVTLRYSRKL